MIFAATADHFVGRRRRRQPAEAGAQRPRRHAWRFAAFMVLCMVSVQLSVSRLRLPLFAVVVVFVAIVVLVRLVLVIAERRDAARRRREVDELARRF